MHDDFRAPIFALQWEINFNGNANNEIVVLLLHY